MTNEKYFFTRLLEIKKAETAIREEFDSELTALIKTHLKGDLTSSIMPEIKEQRKLRAEILKHPYRLYLELKEEARTAAPQFVDAIGTLADQLGTEIMEYA